MLNLPNGRKVLALDLVVVLWTVAWIIVGVVVAETVADLAELTGAFRSVGGAIGGVGETLGNVNVPLLGAPLDRASGAISEAGREIVARGDSVRFEVERAAMLLGATVAAIPILTLALTYAPARAARATEVAALRRLLATRGDLDDPGFESFLAARALNGVSYRRLVRIATRPWELETPTTRRALAEAELRRLGLGARGLDARRTQLAPEREPPP